MKRRELLSFLGALFAVGVNASRASYGKEVGLYPTSNDANRNTLPKMIEQGSSRKVLTEDEEATVTAVFDRLIPEDGPGPSASNAGCVDFLDAQLADAYGEGSTLYRQEPEQAHEEQMLQRAQFISTPRARYHRGLKALNAYALITDGVPFAKLPSNRQDQILVGMEQGIIKLDEDFNTKAFFELMLMNVREGYFADPCYGGNKDMAGWKMIGFPGARYDYRAHADRTGEELDLLPISLVSKDWCFPRFRNPSRMNQDVH
ncbi:gluconate 2-dehydrogenase subunit 3 family protein [Rhizobium laguerreae]|uniref:Gluconate 2-dehydrogenase subunit 3 family protein n=1 Tax=Rhizobium laguerreae TaxID=1076926 RepID=A0A7Y2W8Q3_9HYPH|nr:gluconate 2-dehydrogenase subunit 3 family protein [Rhizobium laguerreae]NNH67760.1 gluconate 2-dehydrogenase subunit 3 family protein [Rhizobium laguerreae]